MRDKKSMCVCGHIYDDHTTTFEVGNNLCVNVGCACSQYTAKQSVRPTRATSLKTIFHSNNFSVLRSRPAGNA
jgi:Icc-related predicted phosphoesterase